jgi:hypothetical protein
VSGAMISDATQVVQSTVKPAASAPKSNIRARHSLARCRRLWIRRARARLPVYALHDSHTCDPWLYHPARARVRFTPSIYLRHTTTRSSPTNPMPQPASQYHLLNPAVGRSSRSSVSRLRRPCSNRQPSSRARHLGSPPLMRRGTTRGPSIRCTMDQPVPSAWSSSVA